MALLFENSPTNSDGAGMSADSSHSLHVRIRDNTLKAFLVAYLRCGDKGGIAESDKGIVLRTLALSASFKCQ